MTIKECIDTVDNLKPNQYTITEKVMWLSFLEQIIINEVLKTHDGYDGKYDLFEGYSEDKLSVKLIVPSPYDRLYTAYLKMKIDEENGEIARYNNSMVLYNSYLTEYRKHYNKTHMPIATNERKSVIPQNISSVGLSDAQYENLKKDMINVLTNFFGDSITSSQKLCEEIKKEVGEFKDNFEKKYQTKDDRNLKTKAKNIVGAINELASRFIVSITIRGGTRNWFSEEVKGSNGEVVGYRYVQEVTVNNAIITPYSKIDLQIDSEQAVIFHEKALAFGTENEDGNVIVYCVGNIPQDDYTIQATVTEVNVVD